MRLSAAGSTTLLVLTACSSTTEPSEPNLSGGTAVRAAAAFERLVTYLSPAPAPEVPSSFPCPSGGAWQNLIDSSRSASRVAVAYDNCAVADTTGRVWTFTTLPQLSVGFTRSVSTDSAVTTENTWTGNIRVESSGVRGTCTIDRRTRVQVTSTIPVRITVRQSGQVCGQSRDTMWSGIVVSK